MVITENGVAFGDFFVYIGLRPIYEVSTSK